MLFPLIFNDNRSISKCWWQCNWAVLGCLHTIFINEIPNYSPILKYGKKRMSLNQRINTRRSTFQCVTFEYRRHAENRNMCTFNESGLTYIVYSGICLLSHSTNIKTLLTMQWRHNIFLWQSFGDNKMIKTRILIHLHVKIWITSNTFSWLIRLTSNKQAKLRVTLRNLFARFST